MRFYAKTRSEPDAEIIGVCLIALAGFTGWLWLRVFQLPTPKGLICGNSSFPCPFCGGTRTVNHLLEGNLGSALQLNPLITLLLAACGAWCSYALPVIIFRLPRVRIREVTPSEARALGAASLVLLSANWLYLWTTGIS